MSVTNLILCELMLRNLDIGEIMINLYTETDLLMTSNILLGF